MLYFAYGSNLEQSDLDRWARSRGLPPRPLVPAGRAFLPDRRLAFTHRSATRGGGVLDVVPAAGHAVLGVLFEANQETMAVLDRKESEGHVYRRFETAVLGNDGSSRRASCYEVEPALRDRFVPPGEDYLAVVRLGLAAHGLDADALAAAARGDEGGGPVERLFVYGTLMRGESRAHVLPRHGARYDTPATVAGKLLDLGDHPGLVLDRSYGTIEGELHRLARRDALFAETDAIEEFLGFDAEGSVYRRAIVAVRTADGDSVPAWVYVFEGLGTGLPVLRGGRWRGKDRP